MDQPNQIPSEFFGKAYNTALKSLSFRPRSEKEISDFLAKKKFDHSTITLVITKLKKQNLINDEEFAKWWIEQRQMHKAKSGFLIKRELLEKGVDQNLIEELLDTSQNDYKTAHELFEKKKNRFINLSDPHKFQKAVQFLQRRGFRWDTIKKVLQEYR